MGEFGENHVMGSFVFCSQHETLNKMFSVGQPRQGVKVPRRFWNWILPWNVG